MRESLRVSKKERQAQGLAPVGYRAKQRAREIKAIDDLAAMSLLQVKQALAGDSLGPAAKSEMALKLVLKRMPDLHELRGEIQHIVTVYADPDPERVERLYQAGLAGHGREFDPQAVIDVKSDGASQNKVDTPPPRMEMDVRDDKSQGPQSPNPAPQSTVKRPNNDMFEQFGEPTSKLPFYGATKRKKVDSVIGRRPTDAV